ncbi:Uncharacterised protein [Vibrio cholerae]|nr:Uncharacterised protein [Vibrio cholerae]CSI46658.1 Uncharacterised protein [Vibrio cholerae]CSI64952.1 Uncharacterised protein [Vibrio cholerae]
MHLFDDLFTKQTGRTRHTNQYSRFGIADHIMQRVAVVFRCPMLRVGFFLH